MSIKSIEIASYRRLLKLWPNLWTIWHKLIVFRRFQEPQTTTLLKKLKKLEIKRGIKTSLNLLVCCKEPNNTKFHSNSNHWTSKKSESLRKRILKSLKCTLERATIKKRWHSIQKLAKTTNRIGINLFPRRPTRSHLRELTILRFLTVNFQGTLSKLPSKDNRPTRVSNKIQSQNSFLGSRLAQIATKSS